MRKLFMALLLALPIALCAQQKIAVVNTQEIMAALPEVKTAEAKIQELAKKYDADIKAMSEELNSKSEAFVKERDSLPEAVRTRRQQEIQSINERIQASYQTMQEDLQKQQQAALEPIRAKVMNAIQKVSTANAITYVMEKGAMLALGKDAVDLTLKVLAELGVKK